MCVRACVRGCVRASVRAYVNITMYVRTHIACMGVCMYILNDGSISYTYSPYLYTFWPSFCDDVCAPGWMVGADTWRGLPRYTPTILFSSRHARLSALVGRKSARLKA